MDIGRKEKKKKDEIWYYSQVAKVRVWQFPTDSQQTIVIWHETDVSRGTGMCLNIIFNLYIACVSARVFIVEFKTITAASGV